MNARENMDCLIRGKKAERIGYYDSPWGDTLKKWENDNKELENKSFDPNIFFDFDMCSIGGFIKTEPILGYEEIIDETDEWIIKKDGAGAIFKNWKSKSGTPEHIDFHMTNKKVWEEEYRSHLLTLNKNRMDIESAKENLKKYKSLNKWTFLGSLFIWEILRKSLGDICMFESLILEPEWIHDINRVYTDFFKMHLEYFFKEVGLPDGVWIYEDLGYKNGLFCSKQLLDDMIFPYYKELVDFFHSYNLPVVFHSCGGVEEALPSIVDAGFDALNPMEVKAGCDVVRFANKYHDKLAFVGGLDARVLESGDKNLIRKEVTKLIDGIKKTNANYVFGSDHSVSTLVSYESFLYAKEVYKELMDY